MLCWPQVPFPESESTLHSQRSWWQRQPHLASFPSSSRRFLLSPGLTGSGHCLQTKVAHSHFFCVKVFLYCAKSLQPCLTLCNPWTHPALLCIGFQRQEYWSGLPFSSSRGVFQTQGSNPSLLHWQACSLSLNHQGSPKKAYLVN